MTKIKINDKNIGNQYPCFTIAEAGANHDGEIGKALKLFDAAIDPPCTSTRFLTIFKPSPLCAPKFSGLLL